MNELNYKSNYYVEELEVIITKARVKLEKADFERFLYTASIIFNKECNKCGIE